MFRRRPEAWTGNASHFVCPPNVVCWLLCVAQLDSHLASLGPIFVFSDVCHPPCLGERVWKWLWRWTKWCGVCELVVCCWSQPQWYLVVLACPGWIILVLSGVRSVCSSSKGHQIFLRIYPQSFRYWASSVHFDGWKDVLDDGCRRKYVNLCITYLDFYL